MAAVGIRSEPFCTSFDHSRVGPRHCWIKLQCGSGDILHILRRIRGAVKRTRLAYVESYPVLTHKHPP